MSLAWESVPWFWGKRIAATRLRTGLAMTVYFAARPLFLFYSVFRFSTRTKVWTISRTSRGLEM